MFFCYERLFLLKISAKLSNILGKRVQKPPKRDHFMDAASPRNHLNIHNLGTTNAIKVKLTTNESL